MTERALVQVPSAGDVMETVGATFSRLTVTVPLTALLPALSVAVAVSVLAPATSEIVQLGLQATPLTVTEAMPELGALSETKTVTLS